MTNGWSRKRTDAAKLAAWTTLSVERFGDAYTSVNDRSAARLWPVLEASVLGGDEARLIKLACTEAEAHGFLAGLARVVANIELDRDGRPAHEVGELLQAVAGSGVMQGMSNRAKGLMDATIFRALDAASQACAIVYQNGNQAGTAFLVRPDLVLTAAHVVLQYENDAAGYPVWRDALQAELTFSFDPVPTDPTKQRVVVAAAPGERPVAHALPHGTPPNSLNGSLQAPPAGDRLDFALIRLARQIEHVRAVDIGAPSEAELHRACFVFGYPAGTALKFDADIVTRIDSPSGRLLHVANTAAGMSGGCCVGPDGAIVGLHEGSLQIANQVGTMVLNNRGISLKAIHEKLHADGADPLRARPKSQGLEFSDPSLVETLYESGLRFAGVALEAQWRALVQGLLGLADPPGDGVELPPFHPWLKRGDVENWIDSRRPSDRLCYISGDRGVGKSFCGQILRGKLDNPAVDLVALSATQTSAWSMEEALGPVIARSGPQTRTEAGTLRYDDVPAIVDFLGRTAAGRRTTAAPLYVAIDFDAAAAGVRFGQSPWLAFIEGLAREDWVRLMLIGLTEDERDTVDDMLEANDVTAGVASTHIELQYFSESNLKEYARALAEARGLLRTGRSFRSEIGTLWRQPIFLRAQCPALQTVEAVLTAAAFERTL